MRTSAFPFRIRLMGSQSLGRTDSRQPELRPKLNDRLRWCNQGSGFKECHRTIEKEEISAQDTKGSSLGRLFRCLAFIARSFYCRSCRSEGLPPSHRNQYDLPYRCRNTHQGWQGRENASSEYDLDLVSPFIVRSTMISS